MSVSRLAQGLTKIPGCEKVGKQSTDNKGSLLLVENQMVIHRSLHGYWCCCERWMMAGREPLQVIFLENEAIKIGFAKWASNLASDNSLAIKSWKVIAAAAVFEIDKNWTLTTKNAAA